MRLTTRIPDELHTEVVKAAKSDQRSLNNLIVFLLRRYITEAKAK
jgi:predicted HicB family RNase H-like nuclease